eukprot:TRINITY_DN4407_c0_g1_i6.p1 TRINITY_DN4407_c0_g1~~TRINITY_DN4407_c0_g1_i6.p1  ORF type:complete len:1181 (+),score=271.28 TRINITY_DN4407_c0_g1_i6:3083-6625(+)
MTSKDPNMCPFEFSAFLEKCKDVFDLIEYDDKQLVGDGFDIGIGRPVEALTKELLQLSVDTTNPKISNMLEELFEYYRSVLETLQIYGLKAIKMPTTITSMEGFTGRRIIYPSVSAAILREGRDNKHGAHSVIACNGVHWKRTPSLPGYEFAVDALNKLISGQGSSPAELLKICKPVSVGKTQEICFQAALTCHGVLLQDLLLEKPELIACVDPENYTFLYLLSILTNIQDGKPDNFIVRFNQDKKKLEIVGIDNDHAFADSICKHPQYKGHTCNIRNVLYFFPQSGYKLDLEAKTKFVWHSPLYVVLNWLKELYTQDKEYEKLNKDSVLTNLDCIQMNIPIRLRPLEAVHLLQKMETMRKILIADVDNNLTHSELLRMIQPEVYAIYQKLQEKTKPERPDQGYFAFRRLFGLPILEADEDLKEVLLEPFCKSGKHQTLQKLMETTKFGFINDYSRNRSLTVTQAMEEVLAYVDLAEQNDPEVEEYLLDCIVRDMPFTNLTFKGSSMLNSKTLNQLLSVSKETLNRLTIINCHNLTAYDLESAFKKIPKVRRADLYLYIKDCNQISSSDIETLVSKGIKAEEIIDKKSQTKETPLPGNGFQYVPSTCRKIFPEVKKLVDMYFGLPMEYGDRKTIRDAASALTQISPNILQKNKSFVKERASRAGALHAAVYNGEQYIVKLLVQALEIDVNGWDINCNTPLQIAASTGDIPMLVLLIQLNADVNHVGRCQMTPLQESVNAQKEDVALILLKEYSASDVIKVSKYNLLHLAIIKSLFVLAQYLIEERGFDANGLTKKGENVLHLCGEHNITDIDCLNFLLDYGANVEQMVPLTHETPLMSAARSGNIVLADLLLRRHNEIGFGRSLNKDKQNLLHLAVDSDKGWTSTDEIDRKLQFMRFILKKFPNFIEARDYLERTPLLLASTRGNALAIEELLRAGADITACDGRGSNSLHFVVELDRPESTQDCLNVLLRAHKTRQEENQPVNILELSNRMGFTPLGRAILVIYKKPDLGKEIAMTLINAGASLKDCVVIKDEPTTILHHVIRRGALQPLEFLLNLENRSEHFSLKAVDSKRNTLIHEACIKGQVEMLQMICQALKAECSELQRFNLMNAINVEKDTAIMVALKSPRKQTEMVKVLLENNAMINECENVHGETPMDIIHRKNLQGVLRLIREESQGGSF